MFGHHAKGLIDCFCSGCAFAPVTEAPLRPTLNLISLRRPP